MSTEKEFGFIITQGITRKMTKAKVADKIAGYLADRKKALMKTLKLAENRIHTSCYYDRDTRCQVIFKRNNILVVPLD